MKTIKKEGYNLHLIQNNNFKTVSFKIIVWNKLKEEDLAYRNMLLNNLLFSTSKYNTLRDMNIKKLDLYSANLYYDVYRRGKTIISEITMTTINDKYSEKDNVKNSLEFLFECINNPNIDKNGFNKTGFEICKSSLISDIKNEMDNPDFIAYQNFKKMLGKDIFSSSILGTIKDVNKITTKSLYNYYKKFFNNNYIDIFVLGDIDEKFIEKEFDTNFKVSNKSVLDDDISYSYQKKYSEKVKKYPFSQSKLIMGANLSKLSIHQKIYELAIFNTIFGNSPTSKLFQTVREKHSFCYSISSSSIRLDNLLVIRSGISYENFENTKKAVFEELDNMKKGLFTKKQVKEAKEFILSIINETKDSSSAIIDTYFNNLYFNLDPIDKQKEEIKKVTKEDIISIANKINIDTIFLLKGDKDEEK